MGTQLIKHRCCGRILAACREPHCYQNEDWLKIVEENMLKGNFFHVTQDDRELNALWYRGICTCNRADQQIPIDAPKGSHSKGAAIFHAYITPEMFGLTPEISHAQDLPTEYAVVVEPLAHAGIIIYAKHRGEWLPNPWQLRFLVRLLLENAGIFIPFEPKNDEK